jgi:hypothetical protein
MFVGGALASAAGLALGGAANGAASGPRAAPLEVADGLTIQPRSAWGADLTPKGPMPAEDVRFLLVHHTASPNNFPSQRDLIRIVYAFHTGPQKRWNDVAYNFFVGPDGTVWEGRAGSLAGPVSADATGGNQGFSQLVCLLGDFQATAPPAAMQASLVRLLAYLSARYDLSTWNNASTSFVSRGSNKWRSGRVVSARTISGHRDMSFTDCPGNGAYGLLDDWRRRVHPIVRDTWQRPGLQPAVRSQLQAP